MSDIVWRPWGDEAFTEARIENRPVLLSITADWCHFCRTMDEQVYGNEAIAQYISDHFVPVRVDADKRPDINTRYAQGGLPSTLVLTPDGDGIWGGTFIALDGMAQVMPQILNAFHNDKANLDAQLTQQREQLKQQATPPPLDTSLPVTPEIGRVAQVGIKHNFDFAFGGFGKEQKFGHPDALELCLLYYARSLQAGAPDADLKIVLDKTLTALVDGGLHDKDAGGFFRYTQTPDWREPHHEKLLRDNALLARMFTHAYQVLGDERWKGAAAKTLQYLDATLYDVGASGWGGSQYADPEYYAQPVAERSEWNPPRVDPTIFCGPNALAARAHIAWWQATGNGISLAKAKLAIDMLLNRFRKDEGAYAHYLTKEGEEPAPVGLLSDGSEMMGACLDLYEAGQGALYLDRAEEIAVWIRGHLEDPRGGGLFDGPARPDAVGNMKYPAKDLTDNMQTADGLLRTFLATGEEEHARLAHRILQAFLPALGQLGFFASSFALASERALLQPILVHVLGPLADPRTQTLLQAAQRPYRFERLVQPLDPTNADDRAHIENLGHPLPAEPIAYVCVATKCLEPTTDPAALTELVRTAQ